MTPIPKSSATHESPDEQNRLDPETHDHPPRSLPEQITFGIATTLLAIVAALLGYVWINPQNKTPPNFSLSQPEPIRIVAQRFYVPFEIKNQGGVTAESVQVLAELKINGSVVESGEQQIDFLSGGETETGAFVFTRDPQHGELSIRVGSYKLP